MTTKPTSNAEVQKAVGDAFYDWLTHEVPISTMDRIEDAVEKAFTAWLDRNKAEIIAAIAGRTDTP